MYGLWIALVIVAGLLWRSGYVPLPAPVSKYGGDALWSLVVFLGFGFLFPRSSTQAVGIMALLFSFTVETSLLHHAPWIDSLRQTRLGALVLGSVFNWPDFAAYALGIMLGAIGEVMAQRNWLHRRQAHV
jgi:hypothetical protein